MKNNLVEKGKKAKYEETKRYMYQQIMPAVTSSDCLNPIKYLGGGGASTANQRVSEVIFGRSLDIGMVFQYEGPSGNTDASFFANGLGVAVVYCTKEVSTVAPPSWINVFGNETPSAADGLGYRPYGNEYDYVVLKRDFVIFDWDTDEVIAMDGTTSAHTVTGSQTEQDQGNQSAITLNVPAQTHAYVGAITKKCYKHQYRTWHLNLDGLKTEYNKAVADTAIGFLYFIISTSAANIKVRTSYVYSFYE